MHARTNTVRTEIIANKWMQKGIEVSLGIEAAEHINILTGYRTDQSFLTALASISHSAQSVETQKSNGLAQIGACAAV